MLVKEIMGVFGHYGIKIDYRHCYLIVDYMTFTGNINPLSRVGIQFSTSSLLKMSFETTMKFLVDAAKGLEEDKLKTPAASIVVGNAAQIGSGFFEIRQTL